MSLCLKNGIQTLETTAKTKNSNLKKEFKAWFWQKQFLKRNKMRANKKKLMSNVYLQIAVYCVLLLLYY